MANFLSAVKRVPQYPPHGTAPRSLKGFAIDKGERYAASFAFGAAKGYYYDRFQFKGVGYDAIIGVGSLLASAFLNAGSGGSSKLAPHLERIGDSGVGAWLHSLGASWGAKKAGRAVQVVGTLPSGRKHLLGAIPAAMGGAFLDRSEIASWSNAR